MVVPGSFTLVADGLPTTTYTFTLKSINHLIETQRCMMEADVYTIPERSVVRLSMIQHGDWMDGQYGSVRDIRRLYRSTQPSLVSGTGQNSPSQPLFSISQLSLLQSIRRLTRPSKHTLPPLLASRANPAASRCAPRHGLCEAGYGLRSCHAISLSRD